MKPMRSAWPSRAGVSRNAYPSSMLMPRCFSSGRRSVSTPVSALTSVVLPWSMCPAVPTIIERSGSRADLACADRVAEVVGRQFVEAAAGVLAVGVHQERHRDLRRAARQRDVVSGVPRDPVALPAAEQRL